MKCGSIEDVRYGLCFDCASNTTKEEWELLNNFEKVCKGVIRKEGV
jgi:hypothetical protein